MEKPSKRLQSIAYHEAGHVVVSWHFRLRTPKYVTIIPTEESLGHMFGPTLPNKFNFDGGSGRTQLLLEREIRSILAGPIAQKKFYPRGLGMYHAASDYDNAFKLALLLGGDGEGATAQLKLLELQTRNLLNQGWNWQCVEAVAGALCVGLRMILLILRYRLAIWLGRGPRFEQRKG